MNLRTLAPIVGLIATFAGDACGGAPGTVPAVMPLGPGPEIRIAAAGTVAARPSVAIRGMTVAVAWIAAFDATSAVYVATSRDGARSFRPPIRIATASTSLIDPEEPPHVFFDRLKAAPAPLVVEWIARSRGLDAARDAESIDGGATFARDGGDAVRLVYTGASAEDPEIPEPVIAGVDAPGAARWRGVVDADGTLVLAWDESNGSDRRVTVQRVVFGNDGAFTRLPTTPVTAWGANTRPAIAATTGGVIVAWVDDRAGRSTIALRPVGLETLCADPKTAALDRLNFTWAPWPSHPPTAPRRHHD